MSFYNMDDTSCISVFNNLTVVPFCVAASDMQQGGSYGLAVLTVHLSSLWSVYLVLILT